jgi:DNA-binding MarR family transcriptional regulator
LLKFTALQKAYTSKSSLIIDVGGVLLLKQLSTKESISIEEIKLFLKISNTKLKKIIYQLDSNKYIKTTKDPADGRRKLVSISEKGRDYLAKEFEYLVD